MYAKSVKNAVTFDTETPEGPYNTKHSYSTSTTARLNVVTVI